MSTSSTASALPKLATIISGRCDATADVMLLVHGWPDDHKVWDAVVSHFNDTYRCIRVDLPHFAGRADAEKRGYSRWGYNFDEIAHMIEGTVQKEIGDKQVTLVCHDWGSHYGFYLQNFYPQRVKEMVVMDVGPPRFEQAALKHLPLYVIAGIAYQYWLLTAFLIALLVPVVGRTIGDNMHKVMKGLVKRKLVNHSHFGANNTADACYPYFYFHYNLVLELFRLRRFIGTKTSPVPTCPVLFIYGNKKGFKFHSEKFEKLLQARDDCDVVAVPCGHWVQHEKTAEVNAAMDKYLNSRK